MKKIFLVLILLTYFNSYSQEKKIIYSDEDLNELTKEKYISNPLKKRFFEYKTENDSLIIYTRVARNKVGRISKNDLTKIKNQLQNTSKIKIDSSQTIVINFYPGIDNCNKGPGNSTINALYNKYIRKISKRKDVAQFFIYKQIEGTNKYSRKTKWLKDSHQLIERTFFKFHYPCSSYVIIKPNGNYYSKRGEYRITEILEKI